MCHSPWSRLELQIGPVFVLVLVGLVLVLVLFLGLECVVLGLVLGLKVKSLLTSLGRGIVSLSAIKLFIFVLGGKLTAFLPVFLPS